jgi:SAM-dependent methyltransferase
MPIEMAGRACPLCHSRDESSVFAEASFEPDKLDQFTFALRKMPEYMHYRLIACPVCDVLYATPVPTRLDFPGAYRHAAFDSGEEARFAAKTYRRLLRAVLSRLPDRRGALDIGTGDGAFLRQLIGAGFTNVRGIEPSGAPIAAAHPTVRPLIAQGIFQARDYQVNSLSLVTCLQTIEHLDDPASVCRAAHRLLKPGGALLLVGHNRRAISARLLGAKSRIFDIEHLQLFSPRSARYLLEHAGFRDVTVTPIFNRYPLHYWLKLLPLPGSLKRSLIGWLKGQPVGRLLVALPAGNLAAYGYKRAAGDGAEQGFRAARLAADRPVSVSNPNIAVFDHDATYGGYVYTSNGKLSSRLATNRSTAAVLKANRFAGRSVIDMGCGDGFFTMRFWDHGRPRALVGLDGAPQAIMVATGKKAGRSVGLVVADAHRTPFSSNSFDVALVQSVLHHDDNPRDLIREALRLAPQIIIHEPNGNNLGLKIIEKVSRYHREHHEKSYSSRQLRRWVEEAGGQVVCWRFAGFVPMFCPDPLARLMKAAEPLVERTPILKALACSVSVVVAKRR